MYEAIFEKIKKLLEFDDVEKEVISISNKILKLTELHGKIVRKKLEVEMEFNKKRAELYQDIKINNPVELKKGEIELVIWEDDDLRKLYAKLKELQELEFIISVAIKEFERRGYALNNIYKKEFGLQV